jgi:hypothetical protein
MNARLECALIGLLAVILAGCAVPQREPQPEWGGISREVGRKAAANGGAK